MRQILTTWCRFTRFLFNNGSRAKALNWRVTDFAIPTPEFIHSETAALWPFAPFAPLRHSNAIQLTIETIFGTWTNSNPNKNNKKAVFDQYSNSSYIRRKPLQSNWELTSCSEIALLGHGPFVQLSSSRDGPSQRNTNIALHFLCRLLRPSPHVTEHPDHSLHWFHMA